LILINAQDKITTNAANIENNAQNGQTVLTAKDIELGTITLAHKEKFGEATDKNHRIVETTQEVGSNIQGAGDIKIIANDTLTGTAVNINSQNGTTTLYGKNSVDIKEGRQTLDLDEGYESKSKGLLSSKTTTARIVRHDDEAIHSNITGKNAVIIGSRGDVNIVGANIVSGDESDIPQDISGSLNKQGMSNAQNNAQNKPKTVIYSENGDVNIQAAQNFYNTEEERTVKKSGLLGTGGIGFTIGQQKTKTESDNTALIHSGSMVGSLGGDTQIYAGQNYSQVGSTVSSVGGETTISADKVDIVAAQNRNEDKYKQTFEQKGLTIALSSAITDLAQSAYGVAKSAEKVGKSKNNRVNAMAAANTAYGAYNAFSGAGSALQNTQAGLGQMANGQMAQGAGTAGVKVSITYGQQKNTQESNSVSTAAQASEVFGDKVNITARKDDLNIIGSDVSGSTNTDLSAAKNVNIASFEEIYTNRSQNKSFGWNAGVAVEFGQGMSFGFTSGANYGKGHENADSTTHRNSHVGSTTGKTSITAGETLNIKGGQVAGKGVDITAKDLNIESLQDTMTYDSRQENISGSITVGYGVSGSANYSKSKVNADYASVNEQSGIFAGDDGYRINVKNHTDLKGGLITSTDKAEKDGKNAFSTGTLTFEDLANKSEYSGSGFGIGIQGTVSGSGSNPNVMNVADKNSLSHNGIGYASDSDSQSSVTKSGINTANIVITDKNKQKEITGKTAEETIQAIKTDITTDNYAANQGSLKNNFDANKVQSEIDLGVEVMQDFSRNVQDLHRRKNIELDELKEELKA
ncbi:MAG: hemagglutinin repeat-containing protein, partial [Neisseriaceae bacterium]|nr:hemagglutinin repeat-containing protein [Neisseriaceae bacterium]